MISNIITVLFLIVLEGLLSFDNALALAAMVRHLPIDERKKSLTYGIAGAFVFRIISLLFLVAIMQSSWVRLLGGAYLLWLAGQELLGSKDEQAGGGKVLAISSFWRTVLLVELTDIAFSVDSILASVAVSDQLWIVALGGILGILMMRFASMIFIGLIDKFPRLEQSAFMLVGIVGVKMLNKALTNIDLSAPLYETIFWTSMALGLLSGFRYTPETVNNISL